MEVELAKDDADLQAQLGRRFFRHADFDFQVSRQDNSLVFRSERLKDILLPRPEGTEGEDSQTTSDASYDVPGFGAMRVASRWVKGRREEYLIQATLSLSPMLAELHAMRMMLFTAGSLAIAAALVGGYLLARRALSPVDRIATLAEQISGTRLESRLEVVHPGDELGHLAQTFNSMLDRLEQSVGELRRFTADAAHELRTPLAVLQTEAEVALRTPRSEEEYRRVIGITLAEVKRLAHLIDRLLELSRRDGELQPVRQEAVPLLALLTDVIEQIRVVANQKGVSLKIEALADPNIPGDDIQLSRVLFNLLENAIKFTDSGGEVTIKTEWVEEWVQLTISDTGSGISETDLPHVFKRFYRADKSRNGQTGGAGLGLAISQSIVEAHRGTIRIASSSNIGTSVSVVLPTNPSVTPKLAD